MPLRQQEQKEVPARTFNSWTEAKLGSEDYDQELYD